MAAAAGTEAAAAGWKADAAPLYSHGSLLGAFDAPAAAADEQPETPTAAAAASGDVSALPSAGGQAGAARANSRRNRRATAKAAAMQEGPLGPRRGRGRPRRTEEVRPEPDCAACLLRSHKLQHACLGCLNDQRGPYSGPVLVTDHADKQHVHNAPITLHTY